MISSPVFVGGIILSFLLLISFSVAEHSVYPIHDFLDHVVTLNTLWSTQVGELDPFDPVPLVLKESVPLGALGISFVSFPHLLYAFLPISSAIATSEILGRLAAYLFMYFLVKALLGASIFSRWAAVVAGLSFALMPYWPNKTWTLVALAATLLALIKLFNSKKNAAMWIVLLALTPHFAYFAWGGYLQPLLALGFLLASIVMSRFSRRILVGAAVNLTSSLLASAGLIALFASGDFTSHREEWPVFQALNLSMLGDAAAEFPKIFLRGSYHFGTFFEAGFNNFFAVVNAGLILSVVILSLLAVARKASVRTLGGLKNLLVYENEFRRPLVILLFLLACQATFTSIYVLENSAATSFMNFFPAPFQISRIIAFSPIIWSMLAGVITYLLFISVPPKLARSLFLIVSALVLFHATVVNPWIQNSLRSWVGLPTSDKVSTYDTYFMPETYRHIKQVLEDVNIKSVSLSFGLDPMVAAQNGFVTLDGYVYNYPLEYKHEFFKIVERDLREPGGKLEYFDDWGSRVYLFDRGVSGSQIKFDWCQASKNDAEVILSARALGDISAIKLLRVIDGVFVYKLDPSC